MKRTASGISAIAGALAWLARPALSQTVEEIEKAAAETVVKLGLQVELPGEQNGPGWSSYQPHFDLDLSLLWWLALAVAVAFFLYLYRDYLPMVGFGRSAKWTSDAGAVEDALAGAPAQASTTADDLAGQGRYVEAMHLLLFRAFVELRERLGVNFSDSLTSREILRRAKLPEAGRASLKDIITRVELSHFGAYPAGAQDYGACRQSYDALMDLLYARPSPARGGP